jgi:hypothetical protein
MDRRRYRRQEARGTARIRWPDDTGSEKVTDGAIKNLSARGILVDAKDIPPLGVVVFLELQVEGPQKISATLDTKGTVNRIERNGFAISTGVMKVRKHKRARR